MLIFSPDSALALINSERTNANKTMTKPTIIVKADPAKLITLTIAIAPAKPFRSPPIMTFLVLAS